jgi:hypothetical protein
VFSGVSATGLTVLVSDPGSHRVGLHDASGREIARRRGIGAAEYRFAEARRAGVYFVRVNLGTQEVVRKVFVAQYAD